MISTSFLIIALIRTVLVVTVVYFWCKYWLKHPPRWKFWQKRWKEGKWLYEFCVKYWWQWGAAFFVAQIVFGLVYNGFVN